MLIPVFLRHAAFRLTPDLEIGNRNGMKQTLCDGCECVLPGATGAHYAVTVQARRETAEAGLTDADFEAFADGDSVHELDLLLESESGRPMDVPPALLKCELHFCDRCYRRYAADPAGRERAPRRRFSTN